MNTTADSSRLDSDLSEGLGLLVDAEMAAYYEGEYMDHSVVRERLRDLVAAVQAAERERCERLRAELRRVQDYIDETPELFEALGPLDHGP